MKRRNVNGTVGKNKKVWGVGRWQAGSLAQRTETVPNVRGDRGSRGARPVHYDGDVG